MEKYELPETYGRKEIAALECLESQFLATEIHDRYVKMKGFEIQGRKGDAISIIEDTEFKSKLSRLMELTGSGTLC